MQLSEESGLVEAVKANFVAWVNRAEVWWVIEKVQMTIQLS